MVADMEVIMVANMEVDMVAEMDVDMVANMGGLKKYLFLPKISTYFYQK